MIRAVDWEQRLNAYLAANRRAVFVWGKCDCALFSANAVLAMTGEDPAAAFRGRYRSHAGSIRALRLYGAGDLASTMDVTLPALDMPALARRGDIVMRQGSLGVCIGREAVFVGEEDGAPGLVRFSMREWERAWRVPFGA